MRRAMHSITATPKRKGSTHMSCPSIYPQIRVSDKVHQILYKLMVLH